MTDDPKLLPAPDEERIRRALKRMQFATWLLDDCFRLPGTERRFGLDGLLGLIPGAGDVLTGMFQMYLLVEAGSIGVEAKTLRRMLTNVVIDTSIGCIPVAGDIFDFMYKSSTYNLALARADLKEHDRLPPDEAAEGVGPVAEPDEDDSRVPAHEEIAAPPTI